MTGPLAPHRPRLRTRLRAAFSGTAPALTTPFMAALLACPLVGSLAGCASPEPRYYSLAPVGASQPALPAASATPPVSQPLWIEVAPVRVPERLNRPQLVVQAGDGSLDVLDLSRWAAPLPDELRDALAQRLQSRLGAIDVYQQGQSNGDPVYRITTEVARLDADPGNRLGATINWSVRRMPDGAAVAGRLDADLPAPGGVDGVVAAMRQVVSDTAGQIAVGVESLRR